MNLKMCVLSWINQYFYVIALGLLTTEGNAVKEPVFRGIRLSAFSPQNIFELKCDGSMLPPGSQQIWQILIDQVSKVGNKQLASLKRGGNNNFCFR